MQSRTKFTPNVFARFCLLFVLLIGSLGGTTPISGDDGTGLNPEAMGFNGDLYADLVVGVPGEAAASGSVNVLYGRSEGLSDSGSQTWDQGSPDMGGIREEHDRFGDALAVGDFDGDGFLDMAVGVPQEYVGDEVMFAGAVNVIYGTSSGLSAAGNQYWTQDNSNVKEEAEEWDHFGSALAAGDFDGNGYDDLAVGVPFESIGAASDAGAVQIFYGSIVGLSILQVRPDQLWSQDSPNILGAGAGAADNFGSALAACDLDGDGYDDLAIGVPGEGWHGRAESGGVNIIYGGSRGLSSTDNQFFQQDVMGGIGPEAGDRLGSSLAAGDFNGNGYCDLAVGVPFEDVGNPVIVDAGSVNILRGASTGIVAIDSNWNQDQAGINSLAKQDDRFGEVLIAGDFDGDGYDDLAIGVPHEDWNDPDTGIVQVLYGSNSWAGLQTPDQLWRQTDLTGMTEAEGDRFGAALAAGDFDADGYADLAVGAPYKEVGSPPVQDAGRVHIIFGSSPGLTGNGSQAWHQGARGSVGVPQAFDYYGTALAAYPGTAFRLFLPIIVRGR